jgi:hypothetical protein
MTRRRVLIKAVAAPVLFVAVFCLWYSIASNYDYGALAGTYRFYGEGEKCILYLHADHTFQQEVTRSVETRKSQGTWHRYGESHVSFSGEFQVLPGENLNQSGEAHGQFEKVMGLFPTLVLAPLPDGPRFRRQILRWN